jgi:hypothetical protein
MVLECLEAEWALQKCRQQSIEGLQLSTKYVQFFWTTMSIKSFLDNMSSFFWTIHAQFSRTLCPKINGLICLVLSKKFYIAPDPLSRAKLSFFHFFLMEEKQRSRSPRAEENFFDLKSEEVKTF